MGVYQSATPPEIREKSFRREEDAYILREIGQESVIKWHRKTHGIPRKVRPVVTALADPAAYRFDYQWYEVETFN